MKLHPKSARTYSVIEESEWTDLDKEIWENFDNTMESYTWGMLPVIDGCYAMGRHNGSPVVFTEVVHAKSSDPGGEDNRFCPEELDLHYSSKKVFGDLTYCV